MSTVYYQTTATQWRVNQLSFSSIAQRPFSHLSLPVTNTTTTNGFLTTMMISFPFFLLFSSKLCFYSCFFWLISFRCGSNQKGYNLFTTAAQHTKQQPSPPSQHPRLPRKYTQANSPVLLSDSPCNVKSFDLITNLSRPIWLLGQGNVRGRRLAGGRRSKWNGVNSASSRLPV